MKIISWDVGIINLAYCVIDYDPENNPNYKILDWDIINLLENERIDLTCCGKIKKKKNVSECGKKAKYVLKNPSDGKMYGYCKTHKDQHEEIWSEEQTEDLFRKTNKDKICMFEKKNGMCGGKAKKYCKIDDTKIYCCNTHYKSILKKKKKEFGLNEIKKISASKTSTSTLQYNLFMKLDTMSKKFADLEIEEIVIENQPSYKNPKMKAISTALFDYFVIRGKIDKMNGLNLDNVTFMSPSNKLKVDENNTLKVFNNNKNKKEKYKLTKELGKKYTKQLLEGTYDEWLEHLETYKKKDDLCDAFLQGLYYLQYKKK